MNLLRPRRPQRRPLGADGQPIYSPAERLPPEILIQILFAVTHDATIDLYAFVPDINPQVNGTRIRVADLASRQKVLYLCALVSFQWGDAVTRALYDRPLLRTPRHIEMLAKALSGAPESRARNMSMSLRGLMIANVDSPKPLPSGRVVAAIRTIINHAPGLQTMTMLFNVKQLDQSPGRILLDRVTAATLPIHHWTLYEWSTQALQESLSLPRLESMCLREMAIDAPLAIPATFTNLRNLVLVQMKAWGWTDADVLGLLRYIEHLPALESLELYSNEFSPMVGHSDTDPQPFPRITTLHLVGESEIAFFKYWCGSRAFDALKHIVTGSVSEYHEEIGSWRFPAVLESFTIFLDIKQGLRPSESPDISPLNMIRSCLEVNFPLARSPVSLKKLVLYLSSTYGTRDMRKKARVIPIIDSLSNICAQRGITFIIQDSSPSEWLSKRLNALRHHRSRNAQT